MSAPPLLGGGDSFDANAPLTPAQMAQKKAEEMMRSQEEKRALAKLAMTKRIEEKDALVAASRTLAKRQAVEQDRVQAMFDKEKKRQQREIEEARMTAQAFRVQRDQAREADEAREFEAARAAETERQRKDVMIEQKRKKMMREMRERGDDAKAKRKSKVDRLKEIAAMEQENADTVALEKEAEIAEKHKRLEQSLAVRQADMKAENLARMEDQKRLRRRKTMEQQEILETKKQESLAHFADVERRLRQKEARIAKAAKELKEAARLKEIGREAVRVHSRRTGARPSAGMRYPRT